MMPLPEKAPATADLPMLIQGCIRADAEAWDEFIDRYHRRIVVYATRAARATSGASQPVPDGRAELVQEVYVRLLANDCRALQAWRGDSEQSLLSYLATIVHAVACDAVKRGRSRKRAALVVSLDSGGPSEESAPAAYLPAPAAASPDYALGERLAPERLRRVLAAVERGPQAQRNCLVFMLHVLDGLTASEIARLPGIDMSLANVESTLRRTKERLRVALKDPSRL
jgi:RNA polymerase sigma factor (sigma-70 family)